MLLPLQNFRCEIQNFHWCHSTWCIFIRKKNLTSLEFAWHNSSLHMFHPKPQPFFATRAYEAYIGLLILLAPEVVLLMTEREYESPRCGKKSTILNWSSLAFSHQKYQKCFGCSCSWRIIKLCVTHLPNFFAWHFPPFHPVVHQIECK